MGILILGKALIRKQIIVTNQYEFQGKTVDDAIADGLIHLGLSREQVDIEILQKGSRGIFGIGSEPAVVRLVPHSLTMAQDAQAAPAADETAAGAGGHVAEADTATAEDVPAEDGAGADTSPEAAPPSRAASVPADPIPAASTGGVGSPGDDAPETAVASQTSEDMPEGDDSPEDSDTPEQSELDAEPEEEDESYPEEISRTELTAIATELLGKMIDLMGFPVSIDTEWQEPEDEDEEACLILNVEGEDLGPLIGRNGETLSNIQYLLRLMINQRIREWRNIVVDIAGYKARRTEKITQLALRMAEQVSSTGRAIALEPMPSNERRVIHMALRDHPDVYTQSTGESERRKVNIFPRHN